MTSAFIIQVQPQLQSDPNEETAALLRVLIHKVDNTTFGDDVPTVPQWTGPPRTIVQVQAILYASLAASLFCAFLAMLGKQWLNRYASIDVRGSAIERSQNRQRKLDGIVTWYFDNVMESLPLMLQFALLLLGCALSRYLWEIDTTVASVVLGITSFGVASYALFIVAGAASSSCPYQTPGANILRRIPFLTSSIGRSVSSHSTIIPVLANIWLALKTFRWSLRTLAQLHMRILLLPIVALVVDAYHLVWVMVRAFVASTLRAHDWFRRACGRNPETTSLDLHCISWTLRISLDKTIHLPTLRLLAAMTTLDSFDPALVSACLDILAGCVSIVGGKAVVPQESEELAALSALGCLRTLSHLTTGVDPALGVFKDMRRRYTKAFPMETDFGDLPSYHSFSIIHNMFYPSCKGVKSLGPHWTHRPTVQWRDYKLSGPEHVALVQLARFKYKYQQHRKVPRWILRYGYHLLSQDPLPPASVVADCLSIIAMDLGHTVSNAGSLDERYVHIRQISTLLTKNQCAAGRDLEPDNGGT